MLTTFTDVLDSLNTMLNFDEKASPSTYVNAIEMNALEEGLRMRGAEYQRVRVFDGEQIRRGNWDAVIHCGSYGHSEGLLEIMYPTGEVEGYLTAQDILSWFDATHNWTTMEEN